MHVPSGIQFVRHIHLPEHALIYPYPTHAHQHHFEEIVARRERRRIAKDGAVAGRWRRTGRKPSTLDFILFLFLLK